MSAPVLFVTNHVPPDRVGAFRALHERVGIELALFGGPSRHATSGVADPGVPFRLVEEQAVGRLAAGFRAVVCGTAGRRALPAAWRGAHRAGVPFLLWSALWHEPGTPAHVLARPLIRRIHRSADAVVTYGPHVSAHAWRLGARQVFQAPQAVDNGFWSQRHDTADRAFTALFVGRASREKGLAVLLAAWRSSGLDADGTLVLVGPGPEPAQIRSERSVRWHGALASVEVRNSYGAADVCVVPSVRTPAFREPWGLVCNEAMNQGLPVITTDETGAAAGGLVRHERNGLVVPAGDATALAGALRRLHDDAPLRERLGAAARRDVRPYSYEAFAAGFSEALLACGAA